MPNLRTTADGSDADPDLSKLPGLLREPLGKLFSRWLAEIVKQGGPAFEADVAVAVPLHRQRERERGYN
jgi:hypothetical protein